jgi:signal transduction histidine kinase
MRARILHIDDDSASRERVQRSLAPGGYSVIDAPDAATGLRLALEQPDLIIIDAALSGMSALEICRHLKADPITANIPVLHTGASSLAASAHGACSEQTEAFLAEPVAAFELQAMVRTMLRTQQAEQLARSVENKWQRTFDAISDGVLLLDRARRVVDCNHALLKLLGRGPELLHVAGGADELLDHEICRSVLAALPADLSGARWKFEVLVHDRWYRAIADEVPDASRQSLIVVVLSDITERKKLEAGYQTTALELASWARLKDEFLAMLAHELRNPLNAIVASTALQDTLGAQDAENCRLRAIVNRQTRHLGQLIDDLLDASRITRGETPMRMTILDLRTTLERVCESHRAMLMERGQVALMNLPATPLLIEGDELRLEQVFSNLLANASKYSEPGARIRLTLDAEATGDGQRLALMTITDSGIGIPEDMLQAVFDMFVQVDRSLARSSGGLGLGLTVVKHVVEQHGGNVQAHSDGVGKGTTFEVRLPCTDKQPEPTSEVARSIPPGDGHVLNVLLVEDNDDTRELVCALLESRGHRVHTAADGLEGARLALEQTPDAALIDIGLPGASGYEVARQVRAAEREQRMFLIAVTGYGSPEDQARAREAGFDAHIVKPFDSTRLFEMLAKAEPRSVIQS